MIQFFSIEENAIKRKSRMVPTVLEYKCRTEMILFEDIID